MAVGRLEAVLTANTAGFDGPMQKSGQVAEATARAQARAAKSASEATAQAAKFAGDAVESQSLRQVAAQRALSAATQDLRRVQSFVKQGFLDGAEGATTEAAALQRVIAARLEAAAASERQAVSAGHAAVSQQAAASAAVRSLEGNPGIRSIERFLTVIPGVSGALTAIFPLIGAAGLAGLFFEMGEKGVEAFQKTARAAAGIRDAFQGTHDAAAVRIADLELENQKIQDQIDKISGHPNNGLATSLLEAKKQADQLLVSLQNDRKEFESLLKEHSVGILGGFLTGQADTGQTEKGLLNQQSNLQTKIREATLQFSADTAGVLDPKVLNQKADVYRNAVHSAYQAQIDENNRGIQAIRASETQQSRERRAIVSPTGGVILAGPNSTPTVSNQANVDELSGRNKQLADLQKEADLRAQILAGNQNLGTARQNKELGTPDNKEDEKRLKGFEEDLNRMKLLGNVSAKAEYDFWDGKRQAFTAGSTQYAQVVSKQAEIAVAGARRASEEIKKFQVSQVRDESDEGKSAADSGILRQRQERIHRRQEFDRASDNRSDAGNELAAVQARNAAVLQEASVNEQAGRAITQFDAATQRAAIHASEYTDELSRLNAKAQQIAQASYLSTADKEAQLGKVAIEGANLQARAISQAQRDQFALAAPDTSATVGAKDALNQFTDATRNSAETMRSFTSSTLSSVNNAILGSGRGRFAQAGESIFRSAGGALLNKAEGTALSALGFGSSKAPKGTSSDPLHVVMAGVSIPGLSSGTLPTGLDGGQLGVKALGSLLYGGAKSALSGGSQIFSTLADFLPGFANGGGIGANTLAIVGEKGPELFMPSTSGTIVPNNKMGMGDSHTWNIDARGSTDPAQVRAQVMQGIAEAMPHITRSTLTAQAEMNRRSPSRLRNS